MPILSEILLPDHGIHDYNYPSHKIVLCLCHGDIPIYIYKCEPAFGIRKEGNSAGAIIEVIAENMPKGLGSPIYQKLDSQITDGLMTINAVKGVEIGSGFETASMLGSQSNDEIFSDNSGDYFYKSNHAGGILGGISTGQPLVARFVVKPTSSILIERNSIDIKNNAVKIITKGRHDPCVGIRAVPIAEAMIAIVLADQLMMHEAQIGSLK